MINGICGSLTLSGEFWAAIAGAIVGGLISLGIQLLALRSAKNERDETRKELIEATAHRLFFKLSAISTDLNGFAETVREARDRLSEYPAPCQNWQVLIPVVNLPNTIEISADELSILVSHRNFSLLNEVADADRIHSGALATWEAYKTRRAALGEKMPAMVDSSGSGRSYLDSDQLAALGPLMAELNSMADALFATAERDAKQSLKTLIDFNTAMKSITGKSFTLTFAEGIDAGSGASPAEGA